MALADDPQKPSRKLSVAFANARKLGARRRHAGKPRSSPRDAWRIDELPKRPPIQYFLPNLLLGVVVALVVGIGSAYLAVDRGRLFGEVQLGEWTAYPTAGTPDADPYSAATTARTGQVPLGSGEGLAFFADRDNAGDRLTASCDYRLSGQTPPARMWTLTAIDTNGALLKTGAGRVALDSREILRKPDGDFDISVATRARPGNWLPVAGNAPMTLVLRLYDTPLTTGAGLQEISMPAILKEQCR
ncbi:DUF1214 domain-containing protein [Breoghania sp.]|uniref:DUF1214 domain-containing protein n=1 Tax=Breoghania sp. TaxID=2065378 RepID=UPI002AA732A4|nr:DUF1214 domain-containing protein [Breoghania sp.]